MKRRSVLKTTAALALVLALGLSLAACGDKPPEDYGIEVEGPKRTSAPAPSQPASSSGDAQPEGIVWALEPRTDIEITRSLADYDPLSSGALPQQNRLAFFSQNGSIGAIDLSGNIVVPAAENVEWCPLCGIAGAADHRVFDGNGGVRTDTGHGGAQEPYVYDEASGQAYANSYGNYTPWAERYEATSGYGMVPVVRITRLGEDDFGFSFVQEGGAEYPVEVEETGSFLLLNKTTGQPVSGQRYTAYEQRGSLFTVQQNGLWGCVDAEGNQVLACTYLELRPFVDGVAAARTDTGWGFVDMSGRPYTAMDFLGAASAFEGRAWVKTEEGWGVIELAKNPA